MTRQSHSLTRAIREQVIDAALRRLQHNYIFPDVATKMADAVRAKHRARRYEEFTDAGAFAAALTEDLRAVSKDPHLQIGFSAGGDADREPPARTANQSLISGERLDGNVGYLRLDGFPPRERLQHRLDALMETVSGTDALIIDLRHNRGGSPSGVMYLAGYLLPSKTLVARIYSRPDDQTTEMWTEEVARPRYLDKPVYILTSKTTFSAAEAAAYHLKHLGRAKTVGEITGGGAHRVSRVDLGLGFWMMVPMTRPINVVTNTDWEGTGVTPDIAVAAAETLTAAHLDALEHLPLAPEREAALERLRRRVRR